MIMTASITSLHLRHGCFQKFLVYISCLLRSTQTTLSASSEALQLQLLPALFTGLHTHIKAAGDVTNHSDHGSMRLEPVCMH